MPHRPGGPHPTVYPRFGYAALLFIIAQVANFAAESPLAGRWRIDLARGTELSPWKSYDLTIAVEGDTVRIQRDLAWGRRTFTDSMSVDLRKDQNVVPVEMWPDNRHLGANIGPDRSKRVHGAWLDDHRILRLSTDLVLEVQQGPRAVNILSDYKVSANGSQLTLIEIRSTRNRPIVYVFNRLPATPAP